MSKKEAKPATKEYTIKVGTLTRFTDDTRTTRKTYGPGDKVELTAEGAKAYGLSRLIGPGAGATADPSEAEAALAEREAALDTREAELIEREAALAAKEDALAKAEEAAKTAAPKK